jgi:hypothetical protein
VIFGKLMLLPKIKVCPNSFQEMSPNLENESKLKILHLSRKKKVFSIICFFDSDNVDGP